jgi:leucyl-tRNA synthetase
MKYDFRKTEKKWRKVWQKEGLYEPDLKKAEKPFYNLMMFPYPSAEGLHVGNVYAFAGSDIYGRLKRMQGNDVFEPIGLDGFGIHSENYALKIGTHPMKQAKISEKRFYEQLESIGNGFAWGEKLQTYDLDYYKWTQWIFVQMFKRGLAYRKKQSVNWCPKDKTVLADEQVLPVQAGVAGRCERCGSEVVKKELEQWFFKITAYAEKLLNNLEKLDWSEKVKIAQRNWIGRSEGALLDFEIAGGVAPSYVLLHGYTGSPEVNFFPWLKKELERRGAKVYVPELPNSNDPNVYDQVAEVLKSVPFDENTVLVGHSLGGVVAMKVLEQLKKPLRKTVLITSFTQNRFLDEPFRAYAFDWKFDAKKIKNNAGSIHILRDTTDDTVPQYQADNVKNLIGGTIFDFAAGAPHATGEKEPGILKHCIDSIEVFTTRPDTLFGATYMVLSPEHPLIQNLESRIENLEEVRRYIVSAKGKTDEERIAEGKEKTGVELEGVKAVNPASKEEIPVWVADYVLASYGTGAIMAVPAHDERDFEFAKKFKLPIIGVISRVIRPPSYISGAVGISESEIEIKGDLWEGEGELVNSGKFDGMESEKAKWEITKFAGGKREVKYRLRDWLISRQRYWGAPIPMIYCEKDGWQPVPEGDLPVKLPFVKNFRPTGTGKSPLASIESFYETKCPKCGGKARRETDVSDTFLDSAWYYLRYLDPKNGEEVFDKSIIKKWLPAAMYIGGAEHAVLHLLYVRFVAMALHDLGLVDFDEPFTKFRAHGLLISEGAKMSKSKGNVVNPDEYIGKFGADTLRMYLMFLAPFEQGGDFRDASILGIERFLNRVWRFAAGRSKEETTFLERKLHQAIKKITGDIEALKYNTAISALMIFFAEIEQHGSTKETWSAFLKLLAPFAPFITEEIWRGVLGNKSSIHLERWPAYNPRLILEEKFILVIQVNGKVRDSVEAPSDTGETGAKELALSRDKIKSILGGQKPKRIVYVPKKLINIVI